MYINTSEIIQKADQVIQECGTRDPYKIAEELNIIILERPFKKQLGVYNLIEDNAFIFIKDNLDPIMNEIVLLHEIGHHILHRGQISLDLESTLFGRNNKMELEANIFTAHISLPNDEFLEMLELGYNVEQIAHALNSNPNLVALKVEVLIKEGYKLNRQDYQSKFLTSHRAS